MVELDGDSLLFLECTKTCTQKCEADTPMHGHAEMSHTSSITVQQLAPQGQQSIICKRAGVHLDKGC